MSQERDIEELSPDTSAAERIAQLEAALVASHEERKAMFERLGAENARLTAELYKALDVNTGLVQARLLDSAERDALATQLAVKQSLIKDQWDTLDSYATRCMELEADKARLDWIINTGMWCLQANNPAVWSIFVPGDQGEPDWKEIATGKTPREALDAAIKGAKP